MRFYFFQAITHYCNGQYMRGFFFANFIPYFQYTTALNAKFL